MAFQAVLTFICLFVFYAILSFGSGVGYGTGMPDILWWDSGELFAGVILSAIATVASHRYMMNRENPSKGITRVLLFIAYLFVWFKELVKANLWVASKIFSMNLRPGIVRIKPELKTDVARTMMANSITLTPGTFTVHIDEDSGEFYIHWIDVKREEPSSEDVANGFEKWARRVME
ncbi:MAG: multicomponent Na+:H+ antiporter subunit [Archaeoglobi archaeon]|nr:multicomponent Na+:H+ antiporter subunit [Archaeoglobi archaeon]MDK2781055.1 multicomponent Na+:H+ antiporter subunit [Archaeoglobi archaeon]